MKTLQIDQHNWTLTQRELVSKNFKAIAHPVRIAIIRMLSNGKQMTVTEIYTALDADQSFISHHLSILREKEVLGTQRMGKYIKYYLKNRMYLDLISCLYGVQEEGVPSKFFS